MLGNEGVLASAMASRVVIVVLAWSMICGAAVQAHEDFDFFYFVQQKISNPTCQFPTTRQQTATESENNELTLHLTIFESPVTSAGHFTKPLRRFNRNRQNRRTKANSALSDGQKQKTESMPSRWSEPGRLLYAVDLPMIRLTTSPSYPNSFTVA